MHQKILAQSFGPARNLQNARQVAARAHAVGDGLLHRRPDQVQFFTDFPFREHGAFVRHDNGGKRASALISHMQQFLRGFIRKRKGFPVPFFRMQKFLFGRDEPAPRGIKYRVFHRVSVLIDGSKLHPVRMQAQGLVVGKIQVAGRREADVFFFRDGQRFLLVQAGDFSGNAARLHRMGFFPQKPQHDGCVCAVPMSGGGQGAIAFAADA